MKSGVLLLAHGAPERVEDVAEYLCNVRGGRPLAPGLVEEIKQRYAAIGGGSPLLRWTRVQAGALQQALGIPVYFGMRNWRPYIQEAMERIAADGIEKLIAVCLAPQYSKLSVGLYFRRTQEARLAAGARCEIVWTKSFHQHPLLIEAFAERLAPLAGAGRVLFTAHSLPEKILQAADPYDTEARATARAVAERLALTDYDFAYQSQGMTDDRWLGPRVEAVLDRYAAEGVKQVTLAPIGFVCDHVETLYDVDILFRRYAASRGIRLVRPESLNGSPKLTAALAGMAQRWLG